MRSIAVLVVTLALAAPAAALPVDAEQTLAVGDDGTLAVTYTQDRHLRLRVAPQGGPLSPPQDLGEAEGGTPAVLPDGTVRVTWQGTAYDYSQPSASARPALRSVLRQPDGTIGSPQILPLPDPYSTVATGADGSTLAAWQGTVAFAAGAEALAVEDAPSSAPDAVAVARGGRALWLLDAPCEPASCPTTLRVAERLADGPFGASQPTGAEEHGVGNVVALAPSGAAVVAATDGTVSVRPPGRTAFVPTDTTPSDDALIRTTLAGVADDGRALVQQVRPRRVRRFAVAADGTVGPGARTALELSALDVAPDGRMLAIADGELVAGTVAGDLAAVPGVLEPGEIVVAVRAGPHAAALLWRHGARGDALSIVTDPGGPAQDRRRIASGVLPVSIPPVEPARFAVGPGPLHAVRGRVSLPVYCAGRVGTCLGVLGDGHRAVTLRLPAGAGRDVRLRTRGARTLRLRIVTGADHRDLSRRVVAGPEPERCPPRPWSRRLARAGTTALYATTSVRRGRRADDLAACRDGRLVGIPSDPGDVLAPAVAPDWVAVVRTRFGSRTLRVTDLRTGSTRVRPLGAANGTPRPRRLVVTDGGGAALIDVAGDGRARVRLLDGAGDRIVDPGPGVEPASLRADGRLVRWRSGGVDRVVEPAGD